MNIPKNTKHIVFKHVASSELQLVTIVNWWSLKEKNDAYNEQLEPGEPPRTIITPEIMIKEYCGFVADTTKGPGHFIDDRDIDDIPEISYLCIANSGVIVPEDPKNTFQYAWNFDDNDNPTKIILDKDEIRDWKMDEIRWHRDQLLKYIDANIVVRNIGDPEKLAEINTNKQILKDLPGVWETTLQETDDLFDLISIYPVIMTKIRDEYGLDPLDYRYFVNNPNAQVPSKLKIWGKNIFMDDLKEWKMQQEES